MSEINTSNNNNYARAVANVTPSTPASDAGFTEVLSKKDKKNQRRVGAGAPQGAGHPADGRGPSETQASVSKSGPVSKYDAEDDDEFPALVPSGPVKSNKAPSDKPPVPAAVSLVGTAASATAKPSKPLPPLPPTPAPAVDGAKKSEVVPAAKATEAAPSAANKAVGKTPGSKPSKKPAAKAERPRKPSPPPGEKAADVAPAAVPTKSEEVAPTKAAPASEKKPTKDKSSSNKSDEKEVPDSTVPGLVKPDPARKVVFSPEVPDKTVRWELKRSPLVDVRRVSPFEWLSHTKYPACQSVIDEFARDVSFNQYTREISLAPNGVHLDHNFSAFYRWRALKVCLLQLSTRNKAVNAGGLDVAVWGGSGRVFAFNSNGESGSHKVVEGRDKSQLICGPGVRMHLVANPQVRLFSNAQTVPFESFATPPSGLVFLEQYHSLTSLDRPFALADLAALPLGTTAVYWVGRRFRGHAGADTFANEAYWYQDNGRIVYFPDETVKLPFEAVFDADDFDYTRRSGWAITQVTSVGPYAVYQLQRTVEPDSPKTVVQPLLTEMPIDYSTMTDDWYGGMKVKLLAFFGRPAYVAVLRKTVVAHTATVAKLTLGIRPMSPTWMDTVQMSVSRAFDEDLELRRLNRLLPLLSAVWQSDTRSAVLFTGRNRVAQEVLIRRQLTVAGDAELTEARRFVVDPPAKANLIGLAALLGLLLLLKWYRGRATGSWPQALKKRLPELNIPHVGRAWRPIGPSLRAILDSTNRVVSKAAVQFTEAMAATEDRRRKQEHPATLSDMLLAPLIEEFVRDRWPTFAWCMTGVEFVLNAYYYGVWAALAPLALHAGLTVYSNYGPTFANYPIRVLLHGLFNFRALTNSDPAATWPITAAAADANKRTWTDALSRPPRWSINTQVSGVAAWTAVANAWAFQEYTELIPGFYPVGGVRMQLGSVSSLRLSTYRMSPDSFRGKLVLHVPGFLQRQTIKSANDQDVLDRVVEWMRNVESVHDDRIAMEYLLATTSGFLAPAGSAMNLLTALIMRVHINPHVGEFFDDAWRMLLPQAWERARVWFLQHRPLLPLEQSEVSREEALEPLAARTRRALATAFERMDLGIDDVVLDPSRAHVTPRAHQVFSKRDEVIKYRSGLKPRTIIDMSQEVKARLSQPARAIAVALKAHYSVTAPDVTGYRFVYASGLTAEQLNEMFSLVRDRRWSTFAAGGDDGFFKVVLPCLDGYLTLFGESDFSMFDQSESEPAIDSFCRIMSGLGAAVDVVSLYRWSTDITYRTSVKCGPATVRVQGSAGTQCATGSNFTSVGNTIIHGESTAYTHEHLLAWAAQRTVVQMRACIDEVMRESYRRLGFTVKMRLYDDIRDATFLKGWWVPATDPDSGRAGDFWLPLPSSILKLGKTRQNLDLVAHQTRRPVEDVLRIVAASIASAWGVVVTGYPVVSAFFQAMERLAAGASRHESAAKYIGDANPYRPRYSGFRRLIVDSDQVMSMMARRYGVADDVIRDCDRLLSGVTERGLLAHPLFEAMVVADYD